MGVVTRLMAIGSLSVFGFIKGFQPIAGYCFGARDHARLKAVLKMSILWTTIFCVLLGLALSLFSEAVISQFTQDDPLMIQVGAASLRLNGLSFMYFGFYTVYSCSLLALGKDASGLLLGACRQGLCPIPVIILLPKRSRSFFADNSIHTILFCFLLLRLLSFDFSLCTFFAHIGQYFEIAEPGTYSTLHTIQFFGGNAVHRFVGVICNSPTKPMNL
ncbi:MAG: hypothetical protein HFE75_06970 [Firmicutes bacterium]|nr:hypothetical protein [Bacillota bacterium]